MISRILSERFRNSEMAALPLNPVPLHSGQPLGTAKSRSRYSSGGSPEISNISVGSGACCLQTGQRERTRRCAKIQYREETKLYGSIPILTNRPITSNALLA